MAKIMDLALCPFCTSKCSLIARRYNLCYGYEDYPENRPHDYFYVTCSDDKCAYRSGQSNDEEESIITHNIVAKGGVLLKEKKQNCDDMEEYFFVKFADDDENIYRKVERKSLKYIIHLV